MLFFGMPDIVGWADPEFQYPSLRELCWPRGWFPIRVSSTLSFQPDLLLTIRLPQPSLKGPLEIPPASLEPDLEEETGDESWQPFPEGQDFDPVRADKIAAGEWVTDSSDQDDVPKRTVPHAPPKVSPVPTNWSLWLEIEKFFPKDKATISARPTSFNHADYSCF